MDSFYTPPALADILVASCRTEVAGRIVDFAAGEGALLKSALKRWPNADITAMDVNAAAIQALACGIPHATLMHEDFINFSDGSREIESHKASKHFDVILLNPPFSCRKNSKVFVEVGGQTFRSSPALAFLARALVYMRDEGELVAILPSSCLTSERDAPLRAALQEKWEIVRVGESRSSAFSGCEVTVDFVHVTRRVHDAAKDSTPQLPAPDIKRGCLLLMRGTIPNAKNMTAREGLPFIHTTDLIQGTVVPPTRWTAVAGRSVCGPALLLPRVGRMKLSKVVIKSEPAPIALSDCVLALKTPSRHDEGALRELICRNWDTFSKLWSGTCASYLTLARLGRALELLGYEVQQVEDMAVDPRVEYQTIDGRVRTGSSRYQAHTDEIRAAR